MFTDADFDTATFNLDVIHVLRDAINEMGDDGCRGLHNERR